MNMCGYLTTRNVIKRKLIKQIGNIAEGQKEFCKKIIKNKIRVKHCQ